MFWKWKCSICGQKHDEVPLCFGCKAPWRYLVKESDFAERVYLDQDICVVDAKLFFIRGHIQIPIIGTNEIFAFSVWCSLSEKSYQKTIERWFEPTRELDDAYFGWLSSHIPIYPETIHLETSVQSRAVGLVPLITLEHTDHPLAIEQHHGITEARWHELALSLLSMQ